MTPQNESVEEASRVCPNPACPYRRRFGHAAEYQAQAALCSDCDTALVDASAIPALRGDAQGDSVVQRLETLVDTTPKDADVGEAVGEAIVLRSSPRGRWVSMASVTAAIVVAVHATIREQGWTWLTGLGIVLLSSLGGYSLLRQDWRTRRVVTGTKGFRLEVGGKIATVIYGSLQSARVQRVPVRTRLGTVGWMVELCVKIDGQWLVLSSFAQKAGGDFERFAWRVMDASVEPDQGSKETRAGS